MAACQASTDTCLRHHAAGPIAVCAIIMAAAMLSGNPTSSSAATLISNIFLIANLVNAVAGTLSGVENQLTAVERVRALGELEPGEPSWPACLSRDLHVCLLSGLICKSVPDTGRV